MKLKRKEQRPGAWHGGLWLQASKRWNKMEWSGVPMVFETCETLVLLDRCRACACFQKSHVIETRWKWDGGGCSDTSKAREKYQYKYQAISYNILFWRKVTLTLTRDLGFKFFLVDMALFMLPSSVADRLVYKFSGFTWFAIVFVHRPLPKHWKSTIRLRTWTWERITFARKEPRPGSWHGGPVAPGLETMK